jgi:hypothetical protein
MEEVLNFEESADPPTGLYWCVSDDPAFLNWVGKIGFTVI